ncbi:hypothetical protein NZ698_12130 [Chryseobacterium sp. PBS4-4]|uniref:Uncharacterized protein n=1 Tax=Chryseobacterium edaphi TaxID=2976532 RepID=A0ABT2W7L5_9FLAO|nr:hypothetical protein [Chryseobacterium edaphi]MCU7617948.1 hypothetical protein [Chryseobacterium edaphi]
MKNFESELYNKRREFSEWFTFSILGMFLFYILLIFLIRDIGHQPFALPKSILILGFLITTYTVFLISKMRFDFIRTYIVILISLLFLITYISMLLCNISKTIYLLYIPIALMVMLVTSFRNSVYFSFFIIAGCFFISEVSELSGIALDKDLYKNNPEALHYQEYIVVVIAAYFTFLILYYHLEFIK